MDASLPQKRGNHQLLLVLSLYYFYQLFMKICKVVLQLLLLSLALAYTISQFQQSDLLASASAYRKLIIKDNLEFIRKHNSDQTNTVKLAPHPQFVAYTLQENVQKYLSTGNLLSQMKQVEMMAPKVKAALPKKLVSGVSIDLTAYTYPVYNQNACGNCYAYAIGNSINAQRRIAGISADPLSIQELTDCSSQPHLKYYNLNCNGGDLQISLWYATVYGLHTQTNYPFKDLSTNLGQSQSCTRLPSNQRTFRIKYWSVIGSQNVCISRAIAVLNGYTVPTAMFAGFNAFFLYSSGMFVSCPAPTGQPVDHAVLIVGFEYFGPVSSSYMKVKNSWGTSWGVGGFFYISMVGNVCNICLYSVYAYV